MTANSVIRAEHRFNRTGEKPVDTAERKAELSNLMQNVLAAVDLVISHYGATALLEQLLPELHKRVIWKRRTYSAVISTMMRMMARRFD